MKLLSSERTGERAVASTVQRRWRWAALAGLVVFLALAAYALAVAGSSNAGSARPVAVLVAAQDIRAGSTITESLVRSTAIRVEDPGLLATLVAAGDRARVIGQVASVSVPAGQLLPAGMVVSQNASKLWLAAVPIKRMPAGLAAGNHVAVLAEAPNKAGQPVNFVFMQDVEVAHVGGNQVDLWLPAKVVPQVEWYADHGGLVLIKMSPGVVQQDLPAGAGG